MPHAATVQSCMSMGMHVYSDQQCTVRVSNGRYVVRIEDTSERQKYHFLCSLFFVPCSTAGGPEETRLNDGVHIEEEF